MQGVSGPPLEKHCFRKRILISQISKDGHTNSQVIHDSLGWIMKVKEQLASGSREELNIFH